MWDIGIFYKTAWQTVKQNRKLWIAGLAVSVWAAGGWSYQNSGNSSSSSKSEDSSSEINGPIGKAWDMNQEMKPVQETAYRLGNALIPLYRSPNIPVYATLGIEAFLAILFGLLLHVIASAWSRGLLIDSVNQVMNGIPLSLAQASRCGLQKMKTIIGIDVLPMLRIFLVFFLLLLLVILSASYRMAWIGIIASLAGIIYSLIYYIRVKFAQIWAYRLAVLNDANYKVSMNEALRGIKGNMGRMLLLGLVNMIVSGVVSAVLFLVFGSAAIIMGVNAFNNPSLQTIISAIITGVISFGIASPIFALKEGVAQAFVYTVWHQAFKAAYETRS